MSSLTSRCFLAFLTAITLLLATTSPLQARTIEYPTDEPVITFTLPKGWTATVDERGNLDCDTGDDSAYLYSIIPLPHVRTEKELKAKLPQLANAAAVSAEAKGFELGEIDSTENENGIPFTGLRGDGKVQGEDFVTVIQGFKVGKGKYFAIITAGSKAADDQHEKAYQVILDSLKKAE